MLAAKVFVSCCGFQVAMEAEPRWTTPESFAVTCAGSTNSSITSSSLTAMMSTPDGFNPCYSRALDEQLLELDA